MCRTAMFSFGLRPCFFISIYHALDTYKSRKIAKTYNWLLMQGCYNEVHKVNSIVFAHKIPPNWEQEKNIYSGCWVVLAM